MAGPIAGSSDKPEVARVEGGVAEPEDLTVEHLRDGLVKSTFDELSILRTLWVFRRVVLVSLAVYTGYVCEGFEVSNVPSAGVKEA